jgi:hypothetical protein
MRRITVNVDHERLRSVASAAGSRSSRVTLNKTAGNAGRFRTLKQPNRFVAFLDQKRPCA